MSGWSSLRIKTRARRPSVKADYRGIPSCAAAKLFYGGNGSCIFGCMGFGDCARACPKGAISMQDGIACVDHTECIGCGICAQTCPQKIIEIVPDIIRTEVLCSSYHNGPYTKKASRRVHSTATTRIRPLCLKTLWTRRNGWNPA